MTIQSMEVRDVNGLLRETEVTYTHQTMVDLSHRQDSKMGEVKVGWPSRIVSCPLKLHR